MRRIYIGKFAADHSRDDLVRRHFGCRPCADIGAVTHDGDIVGDPLDLIHLVRNIDHCHSLVTKVVHDAEEHFNFFVRERGCRFVEDNDLSLVGDRLRDLDRLHLSDGKLRQHCLGIEIHTDFLEPVGGVLIHLFVINDL